MQTFFLFDFMVFLKDWNQIHQFFEWLLCFERPWKGEFWIEFDLLLGHPAEINV